MAQAEGGARISGQILGYLIAEGAPRTLSQMTEALKISKASASTNARLLELRGALRRVSPVGQRQDAYEAVPEPGLQTLSTMAARFRANAGVIRGIGAEFSEARAGERARVEHMAEFYGASADFIDEWVARVAETGCTAREDKEE